MALIGKRKALREAAGIPNGSIVILYQGAIEVDRGLSDVSTVLARLPQHVYFVMMGYGGGCEEVATLCRESGASDRVRILPPVKQHELMDYTADADIGIIPLRDIRSHRFACPGKLFEFIGAGLPLVVSDLPDLARFVRTYELGEVFKSGDTADLERALMALIKSSEYRKQCKRKALALHESTVCWEAQSKKLCEIILR